MNLVSTTQPGHSARLQLQCFCCFICFNLLYFIIGLACEVASVYVGVYYFNKHYNVVVNTGVITAIVSVTSILGFTFIGLTLYGCYAYTVRSKSSLILFTLMHIFLFIIVVAISITGMIFTSQKTLLNPVSPDQMDNFGSPGFEEYTHDWNNLQIKDSCCGFESWQDWYVVPDSCCFNHSEICTNNTTYLLPSLFHKKGCFEVVSDSLSYICYFIFSFLLLCAVFLGSGLFFSVPVCQFTLYYRRIGVDEIDEPI